MELVTEATQKGQGEKMTIPDCTLTELCRWAETWLPTLAPADVRGPVYVVPQELPSNFEATVGRDMDLAYCEEIGQRWRGRGTAIMVDLQKFALDNDRLREVNHADDATIREMEGMAARRLLRVLLHEAAHAIEWLPMPAAATPAIQRQARQTIDAEIWTPTPAADPRLPAPFFDHGGDFVRAAIHLLYRAKRQGVTLPLSGLAAGWRYGMAKIESYRAALGNEPWRLRDASFREIAKTPPPKRFVELWHHDVGEWLRRCAKQGPITDEIFKTAWHAANALPGPLVTKEKIAAIVPSE